MSRRMPIGGNKSAAKRLPIAAYQPDDKRTPQQRMADETRAFQEMANDLGLGIHPGKGGNGTTNRD